MYYFRMTNTRQFSQVTEEIYNLPEDETWSGTKFCFHVLEDNSDIIIDEVIVKNARYSKRQDIISMMTTNLNYIQSLLPQPDPIG